MKQNGVLRGRPGIMCLNIWPVLAPRVSGEKTDCWWVCEKPSSLDRNGKATRLPPEGRQAVTAPCLAWWPLGDQTLGDKAAFYIFISIPSIHHCNRISAHTDLLIYSYIWQVVIKSCWMPGTVWWTVYIPVAVHTEAERWYVISAFTLAVLWG